MSLTIKGSLLVGFLAYTSVITMPEVQKLTKRDTTERQCLIEAISHEALNQPLKGQKAVLDVITNRVNTKGFPNSICAVVHAPKAFSYRNHLKPGKSIQKVAKNIQDSKAMKKIENLVDFYLHGEYTAVLSPNVLWYSRNEIRTSWMKNLKVEVVIADHKFMKG